MVNNDPPPATVFINPAANPTAITSIGSYQFMVSVKNGLFWQ
jgi:hypothetical protein